MQGFKSRISTFLIAACLFLAIGVTAQTPAIRIMPLGDSITYGSPVAGGYRLPLYIALTNAGYNVDYVGSQNGNSATGLGAEVNHEGHGGWKISDPSIGLYENMYGWFETIEDPHVVLVHIGTNDSGGGTLFTNAVDRLDALITRIALCQPSAHIIVTTLMKRTGSSYTAITNYFNPFVPGKVTGQQGLGRRVHFLDMHAYLELSDMADGLHPNAGGYVKMANAWFPAITNIIGTNTVANQPAPIRGIGSGINRTTVNISFNKALSDGSATNPTNYSVSPTLSVSLATLSGDKRTVTLTTSPQAPQTTYTVTLSNITDRTLPAALTIPAGSQVSFMSPSPPALLSANGRSNLTQVDLLFSKGMSASGATNTANYTLSGGLGVLAATLSGDHKTVTLTTGTQFAGTNYTVTVNNLQDETIPTPFSLPENSQVSFKGYKAPLPRGYWNHVAESAFYAPVYSLDLATTPNYSTGVPYSFDNSALVGGFDRVAYYLELQKSGEDLQYAWVSMDAFTNRADKLGIPTLASGAFYQQYVQNLHIECNVPGVATGNVVRGNIEFWPFDYSAGNVKGIPNASASTYDFGDQCSFVNSYSCMQVHNYAATQTVFALNHWNSGNTIEIGIGNQPTNHPDWTFNGNGGAYTVKTLYVLVRRDASDTTHPTPLSARADLTRQIITVTFSEPLNASSADCRFFALDNGVQVLGATLLADQCSITLTTTRQPATPLTLSIAGVRDSSPNANAVPPGTTITVAPPSLPSEIVTNVGTNSGELAAGYELVYTLDIPVLGKFNSTPDPYRVNYSQFLDAFDRIAYYIELQKTNGTTQYIWTSMNAFTSDKKKIGVPTVASGAIFQQFVSSLDVKSNVAGISNGINMAGGNLEFWPQNYSATNYAGIPGASENTCDFGDRMDPGGHGSMQVHNYLAKQTLFAINNWGSDNQTIAIGIGNRPTGEPDWTFAANAGTDYTRRTLHVLMRPAAPPALPPQITANVPDAVGYRHVYTIDLPINGNFFTNASSYFSFVGTNGLPSFSRVAYYLELQSGSDPTQYIWTAMDAFTTDPAKLGVPGTNTLFQTRVAHLDVRSNVGGIVNGTDFDTGNIEFWPSDYNGGNSASIPNADNANFDFGDGGGTSYGHGYGSMQIHNYGAGVTQTLFAVNNFNKNSHLCIGIGNCPAPVNKGIDWTFKSNANTYNHRRLYVFVLNKGNNADLIRPTLLNATGSLTLNQIALSFSESLADGAAKPSFFAVSNGVTVTDAQLTPNKRDVILTTSPLTAGQSYTVYVTGVRDRSWNANPIAPGSSITFRAPIRWTADVLSSVPEAGDYELLSYLAVSNSVSFVNGANYLFDESKFQRTQPFDRLAYCMELVTNGVTQWVWVSMDAFTNDLSLIGVPTADRNARYQQYVSNLNVYASANVANMTVTTGVGIVAGNIEFWPNNYGTANAKNIPGADSTGATYDFGDTMDANVPVGHGSMQVHNYLQGHTIFSLISFGSNGRTPGLGIGNNPKWTNNDPDWTFTSNAAIYSKKNIFILARHGLPTGTTGTRPDLWNQPRPASIHVGESAFFSIYSPNATAYQWRHNGVGIPGANQSWLQFVDANLSDAGTYDVLVYGTGNAYVVSQSATLQVIPLGSHFFLK